MKQKIIFSIFLLSIASLKSQIPLDTIITKNGVKDTIRVLSQDEELIYYLKGDKEAQFPIGLIKEIKYGFDFSLEVDDLKKSIRYDKVIPAKGKTKGELYLIAREWIVDAFIDAKEVIQLDDKETGKIIGKGSYNLATSILGGGKQKLNFTIKIYTKDGRMKFILENFYITDTSLSYGNAQINISSWFWKNNGKKRKSFLKNKNRIETICKRRIIGLISKIKSTKSIEDDDW